MNLAFALKLLFPVFFEVVLVVALGVVFGFGFEVVAHPPSAVALDFLLLGSYSLHSHG
jgi:hypothetical protein